MVDELMSHTVSSSDVAVTENAVNGAPVEHTHGRHRRRWQLGAGSGEPGAPRDRTARLRLLAASAIGVAFLFLAYWLAPEQHSLLAAPSGAVGWIATICGIAGVWLVPGLWICAVLVRIGVGPAAWLGARIAATLSWYAAVGPVIHHVGKADWVTTFGILTVTTAATAAVSLGVVFGLSRRPAERWRRVLVAAAVGGGGAQVALWASRLWTDDGTYIHGGAVDALIVLACALLVAVGMLSRPNLPTALTARNMRTPLIALAVIAVTAGALLAVGARWSPAQRMPSSFSAEQIPAPAGADVALSLTAIGPGGSGFVRRADFTAADDTGRRPVPVDTRLLLADDTADRATLLVVLPRSSQPELCGTKRVDLALKTRAPIKLTMRDRASGLTVQPAIPIAWCTG
jgi:hypothetical protein